MNYKKIYDSLVLKSLSKEPTKEYTELHHIIPKCMGGNDNKENLVRFTAREHYIAHSLLYKHYKTTKLAYAWICMFRCDPNQERKFSSREYQRVRKILNDRLKIEMVGNGNNFFGRKHTEETKRIISEKIKKLGRKPSPETMKKIIEKASRPKTAEHRAKIGRKGFMMLKNINTNETLRIKLEDRTNYDKDIWMVPFKIKMIRLKENSNEN
jgi:hypothetical protein